MVAYNRRDPLALSTPAIHILDGQHDYDGSQLRPHWIYETVGESGDAIAVFQGRADVAIDRLVDIADVLDELFIASDMMLHFIVESFGPDLDRAVLLQRLLMFVIYEQLELCGVEGLRRSGDDLFVGDGKLSVSIATVSRVSCLIHVGVNIVNEGTPVQTSCLNQVGVDPMTLGPNCAAAYARELTEMRAATTKVKGV
jgi:hypothetical protein